MLLAAETISFPHLGWSFSVDPVLVEFNLFGIPFSIHWYGVIIALGFLLAIIYGMRRAPSFGINTDKMLDTVLVATVFAFVGARLYYVAFDGDWSSVFAVWEGGLAIYGGILGGLLAGLIMCKFRKIAARPMLDLAALGFLIGQGIGRWGNFFNQEAFGTNTDLLWGMTGSIIQAGTNGSGYNPNLPVHPTFLYESLWCLLGFLVLHIVSKKFYRFSGQIFASYLIWYGAERLLVEGLRTDSLMLGGLRVSQWLSLLAVVLGIVLLLLWKRLGWAKQTEQPQPVPAEVETAPTENAPTVFSTLGIDDTEPETDEQENADESEIEEGNE